MASFVDTTAKEIERRLSELRQEVSRLEGALAALGGARRGPGRPPSSGTGARRRTSRSTSGRRRGAPRGRRGGNTRANQALELVRQKPGITIPELASDMNIQPNYLYRVLPKLAEEGKVRRDGQGWHPGE